MEKFRAGFLAPVKKKIKVEKVKKEEDEEEEEDEYIGM